MPRDSQSVALELLDLVRRTAANQDHCRKLIAIKLEMIYDFAYAMGYKAGKEFAKEHSFDRGFVEGTHFAQTNLPAQMPAPISVQLSAGNPGAQQPAPSTQRGKRRPLFGLPCEVCGALFVDNKCPVCSAREAAGRQS